MAGMKKLELSLNYSTPSAPMQFAWQMHFNRFAIEPEGTGKIVSFASVYDGQAKEIVPIYFSRIALIQCRQSVETYLPTIANVGDAPADTEKLPSGVKRFSNLFSNQIRFSRSAEIGEIALYTIPLSFLADEIHGRRKPKGDMPIVAVALLHSDVKVHCRLINRLLEGVPSEIEDAEGAE